MTGPLALSALLLALYGTGHCAAMCGGFVAATAAPAARAAAGNHGLLRQALPMHAGRLASYAAAGAMAGLLGATPAMLMGSTRFHLVLFSLGALMLVVTGLRIAGVGLLATAPAHRLDSAWQRGLRFAQSLGTSDSASRRAALGVLWGWAPCALVYSALPIALVSGSAFAGAGVMLAFGAGTLPALLGAGWALRRGGLLLPSLLARRLAGSLLVVLAIAGVFQAAGIADTPLGAFCISAPAGAR